MPAALPIPMPPSEVPSPPAPASDWVAVLLLFAAGLVVRLLSHSHNALSLDEATSVLIASHSGLGIVRDLSRDGNAPLYYFLLHGWMTMFGDGEDSVRALSLLAGALLAPGLYLAARRFVGPTAALTSGILAVLWPRHVGFSNFARMYAFLPVLSLLFFCLLLIALEAGVRGSRARWAAVGVSALAIVWTHNYGMFVVATAPVVWWLWRPRAPGVGRRLAVTLGVVAVLDAVWLPVVLHQTRSGVGDFIAPLFSPLAPVQSLLQFGAAYQVQYGRQLQFDGSGTTPFAIAWVLFAGVGATLLALRDPVLRVTARAWLAMLLVPIGIPWVISLVFHPIYLVGRYDIVAYPAFALLLGTGAEAVRRRLRTAPRNGAAIVASLLTAYAALAVVTLVRDDQAPPDRLSASMASAIAVGAAPGDLVITTSLTRAPLEYYLRHLAGGHSLALRSVPASTDLHVGWFDFRNAASDSAEVDSEVVALVDGARRTGHSVIVVGEAAGGETERDIRILRDVLSTRATTADMLMDYYADDADQFAADEVVLYHFRLH